MFKFINNQAPKYLQISLLREQHNLNTRYSQNDVIVPHVKYFGASAFVYNASTLWNSLPPNLQCTNAKYEFKKGVKFDGSIVNMNILILNTFIYLG